jgi:uncharacterized membrane protein
MNIQNNKNLINENLFFNILLISILLIGIGIRMLNLGNHELWFDEDLSLNIAQSTNLFSYTKPNPPLYFLLLSFWIRFMGTSEFALRFLSVVFGIGSVYMCYKIGRLFFDRSTGLMSALIISISPIHIWYSQEARGYTLSVFLIMATAYYFILALKENKLCLWVNFILLLSLSVYTNYFSLLIIISTGTVIIFLKNYQRLLIKWLLICFSVAILFSPWGFYFLRDALAVKSNFWLSKPSLQSLLVTLENFNVGYNAAQGAHLASVFIYLPLLILGVFYAKKEKAIILLSFLLLPILITFVISQWTPVYIDRQLILFSPFYYILIAAGLMKIKKTQIKIIFLGFIFILSLSSLRNYYLDYLPSSYIHYLGVSIKKPFKPTIKYIKENLKKGDVIAHTIAGIYNPFVTYWNSNTTKQYYFIIPYATDPYWREVFRRKYLDKENSELIDLTRDAENISFDRIWLITSSWLRDGHLDSNSSAVKEWIKRHYLEIESKEFDGIFVSLYKRGD